MSYRNPNFPYRSTDRSLGRLTRPVRQAILLYAQHHSPDILNQVLPLDHISKEGMYLPVFA